MTDLLTMLRLPQVVDITGCSPTTIWRKERAGQFPSRRRLGANIIAWRSDEIQAWCESRPLADEANGDAPSEVPPVPSLREKERDAASHGRAAGGGDAP